MTPRGVIGALAPWDEMRARFRWAIPPRFNLARGCCDEWTEAEPGRVAIVDRTGPARDVWTYGRLRDASARLAGALAARGVARGDRVALYLPQGPWVMAGHLAAHRLGAVSLPLFTAFRGEALAYRLRDSGACAALTDDEALPRLLAVRDGLPDLATVLTTGGGAGAEPLTAALDMAPVEGCADTGADDPAMMIYTSGTTGAPKGVLHAHRFLWGHLPAIETGFAGFPRPDDVGWTPADWAWIGGLMDLALPCLWYGVPLVAARLPRFDASDAARLMREERVTVAFLPPTALKLMRRDGVGGGGLALRAASSGGEALGADLLDWAERSLGATVAEIYGQTECNLAMASCPGTQDRVPGTLGRAVPGVEAQVQGPDGAEVADGAVGEICLRGSPAAFLGYWGRPEATAAKWRDGWLRTGDLGRREGATIRFHARDDDVINSAGYRIGPGEVEACLAAHPAVVMAAVVGLPDPERGEAVTAFVVAPGATEAELIAWVRERLSPHVAPRRVVFRDELPMTATGKLRRAALREEGGEAG